VTLPARQTGGHSTVEVVALMSAEPMRTLSGTT